MFFLSFNKYLLSTYSMPDAANKVKSLSPGLKSPVGETDQINLQEYFSSRERNEAGWGGCRATGAMVPMGGRGRLLKEVPFIWRPEWNEGWATCPPAVRAFLEEGTANTRLWGRAWLGCLRNEEAVVGGILKPDPQSLVIRPNTNPASAINGLCV